MENLYLGIDVHFRSIPMSKGLKGILIEDDGMYLICINSRLPLEKQKKAIKHEIAHLILDHLHSDGDLEELERGMNT